MTEDLQKQVNIGGEAQRLLENPAFEEVFRRMDSDLQAAWMDCDVRDTEGQRLLLQQAKVMKHFKGNLTRMIEQGKMAASKLPISDILGENAVQRGVRALRKRTHTG